MRLLGNTVPLAKIVTIGRPVSTCFNKNGHISSGLSGLFPEC